MHIVHFIISISVCVRVPHPWWWAGGAWGLEWQLPPCDCSSEGCPTSNRIGTSQPHPQLHHCPLLQVVQVGTGILHLCQMLLCSVWFTFHCSLLAMFCHFLFTVSSFSFPPEQLSLLFHVLYATDFILQLLWPHCCLLYPPVITVSTLHTPRPFLCLSSDSPVICNPRLWEGNKFLIPTLVVKNISAKLEQNEELYDLSQMSRCFIWFVFVVDVGSVQSRCRSTTCH